MELSAVLPTVSVPSGRCCEFAAVGLAARDLNQLLHGRRSAAAAPQHGVQQQVRGVSADVGS